MSDSIEIRICYNISSVVSKLKTLYAKKYEFLFLHLLANKGNSLGFARNLMSHLLYKWSFEAKHLDDSPLQVTIICSQNSIMLTYGLSCVLTTCTYGVEF
jgi:hypothetical protein